MNKQFNVELTDEERRDLKRLIESGRKLARKITRARILLLAAGRKKDREFADALQITVKAVYKVPKRFFIENSLKSLEENPRSAKPPKLEGLTAANTTPPPVRTHLKAEAVGRCTCWPIEP